MLARDVPATTSPGRRLPPVVAPRRRPARRGYVLLLVLVVLTIAAAALAGACRASLAKATHAARAGEDLQRRWATVSCRAVLLPKAEGVLARSPEPAPEVRRDVRLGNLAVTLVFGDEQAKANVNAIYRDGGLPGAERAVRQVVRAADGVTVDLRPLPTGRPSGGPADEAELPIAFESLGQVFGATPPALLAESGRGGSAPASAVTCWGDGSIHFRRASREAVREACGPHVPAAEVTQLLAMRDKDPKRDPSELLDRLKLTEKARERLDELLVDESACHSLWVITRTGRRSWYDLSVADESGDRDGARLMIFDW